MLNGTFFPLVNSVKYFREILTQNLTPYVIKNPKGWEIRTHPKPTQTAFPPEEEKIIVHKIIEVIKKREPVDDSIIRVICEEHRREMIEQDPRNFTKWRLSDCRFSDTFVRDLLKRQKDYLTRKRPVMVEGIRTEACTAENIGSFFAMLKLVYADFKIHDKSQVYNLDETGFTPSNDMVSTFVSRTVTLANTRHHEQKPRFAYSNRITVLECICADGTRILPMFVFKGVRYPKIKTDSSTIPVSSYLSDTKCVMRKKLASVDTLNFLTWADDFISYKKSVHGMTENIVLIYDGYRAHMSLDVIEKFMKAGVMVVAIPSHLSHILQTLDVTCFRGVKNSTRAQIKEIHDDATRSAGSARESITLKQILDCIVFGMTKGCSSENIVKGFKQSGIWPIDPCAFGQFPIMKHHRSRVLLSKPEYRHKYAAYKHQMKYSFHFVTMQNGYINTSKGALLSSARAITTIKKSLEPVFTSGDEYSE